MAVPDFLTEMQSLGYTAVEHWEAFERKIRVPFEPQCSIDCYRGFYFRRER
jgi:hypothetical protein